MKKFLQLSLIILTIFIAVIMSGCDVFDNFQFGLPFSFTINASGTDNPSGSESYCLEEDETYLDYADQINSIVYVEAYIVTLSVNPTTITGNGILRLYEGTSQAGTLLFEHIATNISPADYISPNPAYKLELTEDQIAAINESLASGNTCFYGEYSVAVISGGGSTNSIEIRVDVLYNVDAEL